MKISQLEKELDLSYLCKGDDREIEGGFCGDLLSWVMANAQENDVWFTVMGNINTIAVASLNDVACIVLCHGSQMQQDALEKAKTEGINILCTSKSVFETAGKFFKIKNK